jgi:transposase
MFILLYDPSHHGSNAKLMRVDVAICLGFAWIIHGYLERLFQKLKEYRRVATRYERLALNYMTMLNLVSTMIWLK